jgi:hypothetical protein
MKRTVTLKELKEILEITPTKRIEEECNAWGCCSPHYKYVFTKEDVLYQVEKFLKDKK